MDISTINKMKAVQLNYWHYDNALWKQGTGLLIRSKPLSFSHLMDIWRELLGPNQKFQKIEILQLNCTDDMAMLFENEGEGR